jgi:hypothetical protein
MTNPFLDTALDCLKRGWYVFPCVPADKDPIKDVPGYLAGSDSEEHIRAWWTREPNANPAIATGKSGLDVLDIDKGLTDEASLRAFMATHNLPETFAVRTGSRPAFKVQLYYAHEGEPIKTFNGWEDGAFGGDLRGSTWGHVMAAGCIHPDSKERYEVLWDLPLAPVPEWVRNLKRAPKVERALADPTAPIVEWRNDTLIRILGKHRAACADDDAIEYLAHHYNDTRVNPPLDEDELARIIHNAQRWPIGEPEVEITIGGRTAAQPEQPPEPVDWRTRYLTFEQVRDAKPTSFLIEGFLALDSITCLAAPVAQRKSLIALNVAWSLCTGEPLFDYFKVVKQPERVVYLCPEMGLSSFSTRLKQIGLLEYVGRTLFCQTMDDHSVKLSELDGELPGAVVIIDTLTRFVEGDQNSSEDMARFAQEVFRLKRLGATVLLLHHSIKGANGGPLSLDSAMRGSSELAAFVTSCWATRLKDPDAPYNSSSLLVNVKQRDFESKPFEVTSDATCRLHILGEPGQISEIKSKKDAEAEQVLAALLKDSPKLGINKLQGALRDAGHRRGVNWVTKARAAVLGTGVTVSAACPPFPKRIPLRKRIENTCSPAAYFVLRKVAKGGMQPGTKHPFRPKYTGARCQWNQFLEL